jgi:hypothetical protein
MAEKGYGNDSGFRGPLWGIVRKMRLSLLCKSGVFEVF